VAAVVGGVALQAGESLAVTLKVRVWTWWVWSVLVMVRVMVSVRAAPAPSGPRNFSPVRDDSPALQPAQLVVHQAGFFQFADFHGVVPDVYPQFVRVVIGFSQDVQNVPEPGVTGRAEGGRGGAVAWPSHVLPPRLLDLEWEGRTAPLLICAIEIGARNRT
jgi:hypothetical protein